MTSRHELRPLFGPGVVWGRPPLPQGTGPASSLRSAAARELAMLSARLGRDDAEVRRLDTGSGAGRSRARSAVVAALRQGGVVRRAGTPDPITEICLAADVDVPRRLLWTSGGGVVGFTRSLSSGEPVVVRIATQGSGSEVRRSPADAWGHLPGLPRILGRGSRGGLTWSVESRLPGRTPRRLRPAHVLDVATILGRLPVAAGAPSDLLDDLRHAAASVPRLAGAFEAVAERWTGATAGTARHGDLWLGNVLGGSGRVTGLVDWDAARANGTPLADLVQLVARRPHRHGRPSLGRAWAEAGWRQSAWRDVLLRAADRLGVAADAEALERAALAWWAGEVAGTLRRVPGRASDRRWVARDVEPVLRRAGARRP